jgi:site-specific recombinase XerD
LIDGFLLSREVMDCTRATLKDYRSRLGLLNRFICQEFPGVSLLEVNRQHIESYLISLKNGQRSPWTVRTTYRAIKAFYRWMVEEELIQVSPLAKIKTPRADKLRKPLLTPEQRDLLLAACPPHTFVGARTQAQLWLLWTSGMRIGELATIELKNMDRDRNRIKVYGKGRKERYVTFSPRAKKAVWRYLQYRKDPYPVLWVTKQGTPLRFNGVDVGIRRAYERAGFKVKDRCHVFRRSWVCRRIRQGANLQDLKLAGGWESLSTLEIYAASIENEEAVDALNRMPDND